jgi:serine/threonine-protein kinase PknG
MVLTNPSVPESRRFCGVCDARVGRARRGSPGLLEGFCPTCRHPFSFVPKLAPGDRVGQYDIVGPVAFGGQGWVYLARNLDVAENFWVVLKGLLNTSDPRAMAAAIAERQFLASVNHANIVKIHTFVEHHGTGYIVMEYVGGRSLLDLLKQRRAAGGGRPDPLPAQQAIAYILGILPAFGYLHRNGLLYCDFKPDNVMISGDTLKLIDLGGVRRTNDTGDIFATRGYKAPELATKGPSVAADVFTIGRTLASLVINFHGNTGPYEYTLPHPSDHPALARHDSLYRLLSRATAEDPGARFASAEEMGDELLGVLREIVAVEEGRAIPVPSRRFFGDAHLTGERGPGRARGTVVEAAWRISEPVRPAWVALPSPRVDPDDPAAPALGALPDVGPRRIAEILSDISPRTVEVELRLARAWMEAGEIPRANRALDGITARDPYEWRADWYRGLITLSEDEDAAAAGFFEAVYSALPGEIAPKLALAMARERIDPPRAAELYDIVSRTDPSFTIAAFGLARVRRSTGDTRGAVEALGRVPAASAAYLSARRRIVATLVDPAGEPGPGELTEASEILRLLPLDPWARAELSRAVLTVGLDALEEGRLAPSDGVTLVGRPLRPRELRLGLEEAYRDLARLASARTDRIRLVDAANGVRPRTLL